MNQFTASLWGDEAWAATLAVKPLFQIITLVSKDTSPPLYYLLLHSWITLFGTSEVAIRSLSFIFFLGTAATVFLIGSHLWDKKTGLFAALLTLFNPFLFTYAFEGRMYALLTLTSTLSVYFFLKKSRLGFILTTTAALYTHHFALFIIAYLTLWRLIEIPKKSLKKIVGNFSDFIIVGLLYLPWLYPLYYQTLLVGGGFWLGKPEIKNIGETVIKFLVGSGNEPLRRIALIVSLLILAGRSWFWKKGETAFLLGWLFAPILLTFLVSQFFQSIFYDRYLLMAIPAVSLILASNRHLLSSVLIFLLIACLAFLNSFYFLHPNKRPFRDLAFFVKKEIPNSFLINYNGAAHHLWESKYYGLHAPIYSSGPLPFYTGTALMEKGDVINSLPNEANIIAITSEPAEKVHLPTFVQEKVINFDSLRLIMFKRER